MFLEISQNLQEKTCVRDSFLIKLQVVVPQKVLWRRPSYNVLRHHGLQFYQKRVYGTVVFLRILWNFYEHLFYRTRLGDCFWKTIVKYFAVLISNWWQYVFLVLFSNSDKKFARSCSTVKQPLSKCAEIEWYVSFSYVNKSSCQPSFIDLSQVFIASYRNVKVTWTVLLKSTRNFPTCPHTSI